jgi:hypothetical protein
MIYPRFYSPRVYVNRSGSLNDPDAPEIPDDLPELEAAIQAQAGEDDYHRNLDAERGEST